MRMTANLRETLRASATPMTIGLVALLVVQLLLALVLGLGGGGLTPSAAGGPLLQFPRDEVTAIHITAPEKDPLVIQKGAGGWTIPALGDFPAAQFKVDDLLRKLTELSPRLPVATTQAAALRFKVADAGFERRLELKQGDKSVATLYLGDSPGFRRLFVRRAGDSAVYEAELALFDASEKAQDWTDKTALRLVEKDIQRVELPGLVLTRAEDGVWQAADLAAGETLEKEKVDEAVGKLADLDFKEVLGSEAKPEYQQDSPVLVYQVVVGKEPPRGYRLSKQKEGEDYVLKVSDRPQYLALSKYTAERVTGILRKELVKGPEAAPSPVVEEKAAEAAPEGEVKEAPVPEPAAVVPAGVEPEAAVPEAAVPEAATPVVPEVERIETGQEAVSVPEVPAADGPMEAAPR